MLELLSVTLSDVVRQKLTGCWTHYLTYVDSYEDMVKCLLADNDRCEVDSDSMFGIHRAPYEKPTPLRCIEPLYQLNEDGSVPGKTLQPFLER